MSETVSTQPLLTTGNASLRTLEGRQPSLSGSKNVLCPCCAKNQAAMTACIFWEQKCGPKCTPQKYPQIPIWAFFITALINSLGTALADTVSVLAFKSDTPTNGARFFTFAGIQLAISFILMLFFAYFFRFGGGSLSSDTSAITGNTPSARFYNIVYGK